MNRQSVAGIQQRLLPAAACVGKAPAQRLLALWENIREPRPSVYFDPVPFTDTGDANGGEGFKEQFLEFRDVVVGIVESSPLSTYLAFHLFLLRSSLIGLSLEFADRFRHLLHLLEAVQS